MTNASALPEKKPPLTKSIKLAQITPNDIEVWSYSHVQPYLKKAYRKVPVIKVESMSDNRLPHDLMIATKLKSTVLQCKAVSDLEAYMDYFALPGKMMPKFEARE